MTIADDFIAKAQSQIGTIEGPKENETIYGKFTGHDLQPWCGSFVMWCAAQVGFKGMPNCVYTPAGAEKFKGIGRWLNPATSTPQKGDLAFFSWGGQRIDHVGIVVQDNGDGTVTTIEGNTSPDVKPKGSPNNGGEVCQNTRAYRNDNKRKMKVFIVGFGRPKWTN